MEIPFKVSEYPERIPLDNRTEISIKMIYSTIAVYFVVRFYNPYTKAHSDYFFRCNQVGDDKTLTFVPDAALADLANMSETTVRSSNMRMAVWMADSNKERVSEYEFVTVQFTMPAPVLREGWITLNPYKTMNDFKPKNRFIKGYHMQAVLNMDYIDLAANTTITWFSGSSTGTNFRPSLRVDPSNPSGSFTGELYGVLNAAGDLEFSFTVTDSRNRSVSETFTVHVYEYFNPVISGVEYFRCNESGTEDDEGGYVSVKADIRCSDMDGAITMLDQYVEFRDTSSGEVEKTDIESGQAILMGQGNVTPTRSYYIRIFVRDSTYVSSQYETMISSANAEFNIMEGGGGAAFGRLARRAGILDSMWDISCDGSIHAGVQEQPDGSFLSKACMDADGTINARCIEADSIQSPGDITAANIHVETVKAANGVFTGYVTGGVGSLTGIDIYGQMNVVGESAFTGELSANGGIAGVTNYAASGVEEATGGKWIDGKPIYRYVLSAQISVTGNVAIGTLPSIPGTVISLKGMWLFARNGTWFILPHADHSTLNNVVAASVSGSTGAISLLIGSAITGVKTVNIIIEYTKSTD